MSDSNFKFIVQDPQVTHLAHHTKAQVTGRTWPQTVYLNDDLVKGSPVTVDIGWVWEMPKPDPGFPEHSHSHDEIVLHIGTDYKNPTDLGGEVEVRLEGQPYTLNKTNAIYIPHGMKHGPFYCRSVARPRIQVAITLGKYD